MVFKGTTEVYERICSNLSNDDWISERLGLRMGMEFRDQVWKRMWKMTFFSSEIGSGFGEPGGTPPTRIPRSSPPPWLTRWGDTSARDRFSSLAIDKNSSLNQDYNEQKWKFNCWNPAWDQEIMSSPPRGGLTDGVKTAPTIPQSRSIMLGP